MTNVLWNRENTLHDDVIKWKHFPRNWPFMRGIHRSPVNSPHKGQWRGALMFYLICVWINDWINNREAGDLRRYCAHYDVIVMIIIILFCCSYIVSFHALHSSIENECRFLCIVNILNFNFTNKNAHIFSVVSQALVMWQLLFRCHWRRHERYGMMTSSNGNIFCVTGLLCGYFTRDRWIPRAKASDAELWCFPWSAPVKMVE